MARFRAITFWGELDGGEPVSVLDARNVGGLGSSAEYVAPLAIVGAYVTHDQRYSTVRFLLDHRLWLSHLLDGESSEVEDDKSVLSVEASDDGNWLVYTSAAPETLVQLEIRAASSCLALAQLALMPDPGHDLCTRAMQVRIDAISRWLPVYGPGVCAEPTQARRDTLLPHTELTIDRFAAWIALNDKFDGLAWAVARRMDGVAVQLQVQLVTSLVEGFHRRLTSKREQAVFPDMDKATLTRIRDVATQAAVDEAAQQGLDPQEMGTRVWNALGQLGDKSFRERAERIVPEACAPVPEVGLSITWLGARLSEPRNTFAHQLLLKGPLAARVDRWIVVSRVVPWLLRSILLLKVGVEPQVLREKYLENESFALHRVQSEIRVRKLGWDHPRQTQHQDRQWTPTTTTEGTELPPLTLIKILTRSVCRHLPGVN